MNHGWKHWMAIPCAAAMIFGTACGDGMDGSETTMDGFGDTISLVDGKGDLVRFVKVVNNIELNSEIQGKFDPRVRIYGYVFEAKKGATVHVDVKAFAGDDSVDLADGEELGTSLAVYGPFESPAKPGEKLAESGPTGNSVGAAPLTLNIEEDGQYLVAFMSYQDTGAGQYEVKLGCEGTAFQCRKPESEMRPCDEGTLYIQGGTVLSENTTWNSCDTILLETVEVAKDVILTISPGVKIQGNFINDESNEYGSVRLSVEGTLHAVGTEEHPIVFTAFQEKWRGLELKGDMNNVQHAYFDSANSALELHGSNNNLSFINISKSENGVWIGGHDNVLSNLEITDINKGVVIEEGSATIEDSVIEGRGATGRGIEARDAEPTVFHRALVSGFEYGIHLTSSEFEIVDSTISNNNKGAFVTGEDAGFTPPYTCPDFPVLTIPPTPPPSTFRRDPIFRHCDIVNNVTEGLHVHAPEMVVVERSNIFGNGTAIFVQSHSLHDDSRINDNNIFGNGEGAQVVSYHLNGTLDISRNYWKDISDPALSANWEFDHDKEVECVATREAMNSKNYNSGSRIRNNCTPLLADEREDDRDRKCGAYTCRFIGTSEPGNVYGYHCAATTNATWNGEFTFTGFSPTELEAGPREQELTEKVKQTRQRQGL